MSSGSYKPRGTVSLVLNQWANWQTCVESSPHIFMAIGEYEIELEIQEAGGWSMDTRDSMMFFGCRTII